MEASQIKHRKTSTSTSSEDSLSFMVSLNTIYKEDKIKSDQERDKILYEAQNEENNQYQTTRGKKLTRRRPRTKIPSE